MSTLGEIIHRLAIARGWLLALIAICVAGIVVVLNPLSGTTMLPNPGAATTRAKTIEQWCVAEKGSYAPSIGPWNPREMYTIVTNPTAAGAIVQCFSTREQAEVAADMLLIQPLGSGKYSSICETKFSVWVKYPEGRPAVAQRTALPGPQGYQLGGSGLCCDQAEAKAVSLGRENYPSCDCWDLFSVAGGRVCRGADGKVYSATGTQITIASNPPVVVPARNGAKSGSGFIGTWLFRGYKDAFCTIEKVGDNRLKLVTERHEVGYGYYENATTIVVDFPFAKGLKGWLSEDGSRIKWSNTEVWVRTSR